MDPSQPLQNARHELFAQAWAKGGSGSDAYAEAGYDAKNAESNATRLMGNDGIKARRDWLQSQAATGTVLTIQRKREILREIAEDGEKDCDRINAIKADDNLAGDGAEAGAQASMSEMFRKIALIRQRTKTPTA